MQIDPQIINDIKEKNDILDVVSQYVKLEKRGRNYIGLCPFHDEKTPSFSVSVEKQICHCFGCKKGGNVFQFIEQIENISFIEAVKRLGENAGITINVSQNDKPVDNEHAKMIKMHEVLRDYYHYVLKAVEEAEPALNYLYERGFTDDMINKEKIGFSPDLSHFALDYLKSKGFDETLAYEAGLLGRNDENFSYYDRFRNRIMFPINNAQGNTVGFSGRSYDNSEPKYLNSPETPVFQKRQLLYHLDKARKPIRNEDEVVLMEGFMDVLKANSAGLENIVATMGTSLSREHQLALKKLAGNITIMYDGDRAGKSAALKTGMDLLQDGQNVFIVPMKDNMDPDEMIKSLGAEKFLEYVKTNKRAYLSYYMSYYREEILNNDLEYEKHLNIVLQNAKIMNSSVLLKKVLHEAADLFKVDFDSLEFETASKRVNTHREPVYFSDQKFNRIERAERTVLKYFFQDRFLFDTFKSILSEEHFSHPVHKEIYNGLNGYYEEDEYFSLSSFLNYVSISSHEAVFSIDAIKVKEEPDKEEVEDYIFVISGEKEQKQNLEQLKYDFQQAVLSGDKEKRDELALKIVNYQRELKL